MLVKYVIIGSEDGYSLEIADLILDTRKGYLNQSEAVRDIEVLNNLKNAPATLKTYSGVKMDGFKSAFNKNKDEINKTTKRNFRLGGK